MKMQKNRESAPHLPASTDEFSPRLESSSKRARREYNEAWSKDFSWHRKKNDGEKTVIFCTVCEKASKTNGFTKGSRNCQRSALVEHQKTASHINAVGILKQQKTMAFAGKATENTSTSLQTQLQAVLWLAKEDIPPAKFTSLINLLRKTACPSLANSKTYSHEDVVEEMEIALAKATVDRIKEKIYGSPYVGVIIDETVNVTIDKKLIVYLRIVENGKAKTIFMGNFTVYDGTAGTITEKVREVLAEKGVPMEKLVGLASDGASVMTGRHTGVGVRLRGGANPFLVHIHCAAHRVALASQDASKGTRKVAQFKTTANNVYKFYQFSATRNQRLKELHHILNDEDFISLKQPCSARWLSLGKAVKSLQTTWPAIVLELGEEVRWQNNPVADGLLRQVQTFSFVVTTHMLADILAVVNRLNLVFQKDSVNISTIKPMVRIKPEYTGESQSCLDQDQQG